MRPPLALRRASSGAPCFTPPQLAEAAGRGGWSVEGAQQEEEAEAIVPAALHFDRGLASGPGPTSVALLVREPWVSLLCQGTKTWELRGSRTPTRGRIALVSCGTGGFIVGGATLVACHGPLSTAELTAAESRHCAPNGAAATARRYAKSGVYAYEFAHAFRLAQPLH